MTFGIIVNKKGKAMNHYLKLAKKFLDHEEISNEEIEDLIEASLKVHAPDHEDAVAVADIRDALSRRGKDLSPAKYCDRSDYGYCYDKSGKNNSDLFGACVNPSECDYSKKELSSGE